MFLRAAKEFERRLRTVGPDEWTAPTPCAEWDVRALTNHMTRGNLSYAMLARGGTRAEFLARRDEDALGDDPVAAFTESVRICAAAFTGDLERIVDYPLGARSARLALDMRTADSIVHTWDLARALGRDEVLDPELVAWLDEGYDEIYADLSAKPGDGGAFFGPATTPASTSRQDRLLSRFGRNPRTPAAPPAR